MRSCYAIIGVWCYDSYYEKFIGGIVKRINNEIPFDIPPSWTWVRLRHIGNIVGGGTPKTSNPNFWDGTIPWLTPTDLSGYNQMYISSGARNITNLGLTMSTAQLLPKGSILYSSRAPIGYIAISQNPISTNQGFKSLIPYFNSMSSYIYYCLKARTADITRRASGTTFKEISGTQMAETLIPLPPLHEQQIISEAIEKLQKIIRTVEQELN